jgi:4-phospho-D-threonate 3-dehydrogenase / 4-phospho-D-erythronate 3-dehydrogenase
MGDPAGVGPEIILKALADPPAAALARWIVVGEAWVFDETARMLGLPPLTAGETLRLRDLGALQREGFNLGKISAACGRAAVDYVRVATELCLAGEADAMVTAPLNKEAVVMSGRAFSGHTEYIAELCGVTDSRMLLASERLRVVHVTTHVPLRRACQLEVGRILRTIELGYEAARVLGIEQPRIGVCGLNPHAGEHGLFGNEDEEAILPAIEAARNKGIACEGPLAPDTAFLKASRGAYDLVVAMYHDQGHIPMKLIDFEHTVNISLGLPIIRTSVDHGTAFDIAGKNQADPTNMKAAMELAAVMAANRVAAR